MNLKELKKEIAKPHNDFSEVDANLGTLESKFNKFGNSKEETRKGIYAISVDIKAITDKCLLDCLSNNKKTKNVIYIGRAGRKLVKRRVNHEIKGQTGTFFRKIGSFQGYKCSKTKCNHKNNYKFDTNDRIEIQLWNYKNLRLKVFDTDPDNEEKLIQYFNPSFNYEANGNNMCKAVKKKHDKNLGINKKYYELYINRKRKKKEKE